MESTLDAGRNLEKSLSFLGEAAETGADLVIFPEYQMMVPDFFRLGSIAGKEVSDEFLREIKAASLSHGVGVIANLWEYDQEKPQNSAVFVDRGRVVFRYRKIHLYDAAGSRESDIFLAGKPFPETFRFSGFRMGAAICYDIRFPELTQLYMKDGIEFLVVQAGWYGGEGKLDNWLAILRTRAIETGCFVAAAAQCGPLFTGHSVVFDPFGKKLAEAGDNEGIIVASISSEVLQRYRKDYPLAKQKRITFQMQG